MATMALRRSPLDSFKFYYEDMTAEKKRGCYIITRPSYDFKKSPIFRYFASLIEVITK